MLDFGVEHGILTGMMTNTTITKWAAEALTAQEGVRPSYRKFAASNGVNYTDKAFDLPDGSHLEFACISPQSSLCRYEWRLYSPVGVIVERNAPTPIGIHGGRWSDYMSHVLSRYNAAVAEGGWEAGLLFARVYNGGEVPTERAITEHRERAAALRAGVR